MANLASHMTPKMDDAPAFVSHPNHSNHVQERLPEVSGISTKIYHHLGVDTPFDPQHRLVTSYILPVPALAAFRVLVAVYMLITALSTAVVEGIGTITYFSSLSYWGDCVYFLMSAIHTCSFSWALWRWKLASTQQGASRIEMVEKAYPLNAVARIDIARNKARIDAFGTQLHDGIEGELSYTRGSEFEVGARYPRSWLSRSFSRPLQVCHTLLVSTVSSFPLVVLVIFWSVLRGPAPLGDPYSAFSNIGKHTLNYVLTMLDLVVLSRTPLRPWWHLVPIVAFLGLYIGIVDITYHRYHVYVYSFFNVQQFGVTLVVVVCLLLAVFAVVCFLLTQALMLLREYVAAKLQGSGGWGSARAVGVPDDACIPTLRGPGPLGGGGKRVRPGHDVVHLRGRFPCNALTNGARSSGILVDDVHIQALSMVGSELNVDSVKPHMLRPDVRSADCDVRSLSRSASRLDVPTPDASSSQARLFRPV
ncbi:hypothetical protein EX895_002874 [Sporisorium graminicola]|uniref:Uncharacterized protein n=1 Tax=Sporisorium graminicola TaxID=280036 RepID=A0A4U7KU83_9BASI|nr:hypothetical protein EX895_002874 [Sporisorium graminicola]TKY88164.1 hypothetical protein EX895_002874 [Sporisorium graminicola]